MSRKGTTTERGYNAVHKRTRAQWAPHVAAGTVACWRCHHLIHPDQPWDLGHDDDDRSITRGPEHRGTCNRSAGGRKGAAITNTARKITSSTVTREW